VTEVPEGDESGAGVLAGTSALSEVRARLAAAVGGVVDGDDPALAVLAQVGITILGPGEVGDPLLANTLEIDETALDEALVGQADAVRELFVFGMSSSSPDAILVGFDGNTNYSDGGYQLNVAYSGGAVVSANIGGNADGSDDGTVEIDGNVLTVIDGSAKGLKVLFTGNAAESGIQLDLSVGIGAKIFEAVDALVDEADGLIENEIDSRTGQNTLGQDRVARMEERLERQRDHLLLRFVAMETALTSMNRLLDSLRQQFESAFGNRQ
jgi:flagellar hook-associated protein 2